MPERYKRLYSLGKSLDSEKSPVIVVAGALLNDTVTGMVIAQLKFKSISEKPIKAVIVSIQSLSTTGEIIGEELEHQYLDLDVSRDDEFGQKEAIKLSDKTTRSFNVKLIEVIFSDNSIWKGKDGMLEAITAPDSLTAAFNNDQDLIEQYKIEFGKNSTTYPRREKDLWICNCGAINHDFEKQCHLCNVDSDKLFNVDINALIDHKNIRIYKKALEYFQSDTIESLEKSKLLLAGLSKYGDSEEKIVEINKRLTVLNEYKQNEQVKYLQQQKFDNLSQPLWSMFPQ